MATPEDLAEELSDSRFDAPYISSDDRVVVVLGAGASISEMMSVDTPSDSLPPTDQNFLARARNISSRQFSKVESLFDAVWKGDEPRPLKHQRMEMLFSSSFLRVQQTRGNSKEGRTCRSLYDGLVEMLRDTLSETTRKAASKQHLELLESITIRKPKTLNVVSFNYDVLADRALREGARKNLWNWSHTDGYGFKPKNQPVPSASSDVGLYKLHGSMNWYIPVPGKSRENAYNNNVPVYVPIPATNPSALAWQRRQHRLGNSAAKIFPLMVPPVFEKGSQIVGVLQDVWDEATKLLREATVVIVWGYSLPTTDYHAEVLFSQCARRAKFRLIVINPDREALAHVTDICGHAWNRWYFRVEHLLREMDT